MFGGEDSLFERTRVVVSFDRNLGLAEHLTGVQLLGYDVDRTAADLVTGRDRPRMRV